MWTCASGSSSPIWAKLTGIREHPDHFAHGDQPQVFRENRRALERGRLSSEPRDANARALSTLDSEVRVGHQLASSRNRELGDEHCCNVLGRPIRLAPNFRPSAHPPGHKSCSMLSSEVCRERTPHSQQRADAGHRRWLASFPKGKPRWVCTLTGAFVLLSRCKEPDNRKRCGNGA